MSKFIYGGFIAYFIFSIIGQFYFFNFSMIVGASIGFLLLILLFVYGWMDGKGMFNPEYNFKKRKKDKGSP